MFSQQVSAIFVAALVASVLPSSTGSALPLNGTSPDIKPTLLTGRAGSRDRYIVFNNREESFSDARRSCESMGMRLATIDSAADDETLKKALERSGKTQGPWWVGGADLNKQGYFIWLSTQRRVGQSGFTNWADGEPNNAGGNEHCIEVGSRRGGTFWNDRNCDDKRRFICE